MGVNSHPDMFQYFQTVRWEHIYASFSGIGKVILLQYTKIFSIC